MAFRKILTNLLAFAALGGLAIPAVAGYQNTAARRQHTQNEWQNIAIGSGAVALLGLLSKDNRLVFAGGAGALYSIYRYQEDQKSKDRLARLRAQYFSKPYFYRNGHKYVRKTVVRNGKKYYQFVRAS